MRERGLLVKIKEDTQSNVIDSHTPGGANTITWKRQKDELFQYKSQTIWKIDNLFFLFILKIPNTSEDQKMKERKENYSSIDETQWLSTNKMVLKTKSGPMIPFIWKWYSSNMTFPPLIYYLIKCRKTTNDNLSTSFKQRIFHFALLIHLFDLQTKTIFNSNFAVYLCGETIIHGKRSLLRMIF